MQMNSHSHCISENEFIPPLRCVTAADEYEWNVCSRSPGKAKLSLPVCTRLCPGRSVSAQVKLIYSCSEATTHQCQPVHQRPYAHGAFFSPSHLTSEPDSVMTWVSISVLLLCTFFGLRQRKWHFSDPAQKKRRKSQAFFSALMAAVQERGLKETMNPVSCWLPHKKVGSPQLLRLPSHCAARTADVRVEIWTSPNRKRRCWVLPPPRSCYSPAMRWPRSAPQTLTPDHRRAWQAPKSFRGHYVPTKALLTKATREMHQTLRRGHALHLYQEAVRGGADPEWFFTHWDTHICTKETKL